MAYDGTLVFDTELDANGFQTGANKLNNLVSGLGIFKLLEKGFQMVTNSVDKAMGRIDTMEQFSRVMTTMTGDVSATNEALAETTEIVSGTAYGLDYAARAVQNFTSRGMEISKSTETVRPGAMPWHSTATAPTPLSAPSRTRSVRCRRRATSPWSTWRCC